jgi:hypothetical protein
MGVWAVVYVVKMLTQPPYARHFTALRLLKTRSRGNEL